MPARTIIADGLRPLPSSIKSTLVEMAVSGSRNYRETGWVTDAEGRPFTWKLSIELKPIEDDPETD